VQVVKVDLYMIDQGALAESMETMRGSPGANSKNEQIVAFDVCHSRQKPRE
jgi:hypothetical protein